MAVIRSPDQMLIWGFCVVLHLRGVLMSNNSTQSSIQGETGIFEINRMAYTLRGIKEQAPVTRFI